MRGSVASGAMERASIPSPRAMSPSASVRVQSRSASSPHGSAAALPLFSAPVVFRTHAWPVARYGPETTDGIPTPGESNLTTTAATRSPQAAPAQPAHPAEPMPEHPLMPGVLVLHASGGFIRVSASLKSPAASQLMSPSGSMRLSASHRASSPVPMHGSANGGSRVRVAGAASFSKAASTESFIEDVAIERLERIHVSSHRSHAHFCKLYFSAPPPTTAASLARTAGISAVVSDVASVTSEQEGAPGFDAPPRALSIAFESHGELLEACLLMQDLAVRHRPDLQKDRTRTVFDFGPPSPESGPN